jgi:hypothetical protein
VAEDAHIRFDAGVVGEYTKKHLTDYDICKPIPAQVPTSYRYAPLENSVERVSKNRLPVWG